jgi:uncharacterized membrane protein (DUF2068 family)
MKTKPVGPPVEGAPKARWHPETLWCSLFGHCAPADNVRNVSDSNTPIALALNNGTHMSRCLRCDMWILTDESTSTRDELPDPSQIEVPKRGEALRDAIVLKVIAVDRGFHAFVFTVVFVGVLLIDSHLGALQNTARHLVDNAQSNLPGASTDGHDYVNKELNRFIDLKAGSLRVLLATAAAYALVEGCEAVGLWRQKRWAEYLTVVATAGFLPFEIREIIHRVTVVRVGAFVINMAVLIYLLWAKRLFGLRGGARAPKGLIKTADQLPPLPGQPRPAEPH